MEQLDMERTPADDVLDDAVEAAHAAYLMASLRQGDDLVYRLADLRQRAKRILDEIERYA
jgi:hypothetical protein